MAGHAQINDALPDTTAAALPSNLAFGSAGVT
jgi:hypothetical protein